MDLHSRFVVSLGDRGAAVLRPCSVRRLCSGRRGSARWRDLLYLSGWRGRRRRRSFRRVGCGSGEGTRCGGCRRRGERGGSLARRGGGGGRARESGRDRGPTWGWGAGLRRRGRGIWGGGGGGGGGGG